MTNKVSIPAVKLMLCCTGNSKIIGYNLCHNVVLIVVTLVLVPQFVHSDKIFNHVHGNTIKSQ